MSSNKLALLVLAAALITTVVQVVIYGPKLPDTVASHFGSDGQANGMMSRVGLLAFMIGLQFGLALIMVGTGFVMGKLPPSMLSIPNKDYWLHEDRCDETLAYNRMMLNWIAAITAILILATFQLTIQANLSKGDRGLNMPVFLVCISVYMVLVIGLCIRMIVRFSKVPATP